MKVGDEGKEEQVKRLYARHAERNHSDGILWMYDTACCEKPVCLFSTGFLSESDSLFSIQTSPPFTRSLLIQSLLGEYIFQMFSRRKNRSLLRGSHFECLLRSDADDAGREG